LLKLDTLSIKAESYPFQSFYFIILCYIEQKIDLFLWSTAVSRFKCTKKLQPPGEYWHLKVSTLKVNPKIIA
jgi:hypothetical protein